MKGNVDILKDTAECKTDMVAIFDATVEISSVGKVSFDFEERLLPKIKVPVVVGGVLMDIELEMPVKFSLDASVSGIATFEYHSSYAIKLDMKYADGSGSFKPPNFDIKSESKMVSLNAEGGIEAKLSLVPRVGLRFYKVAAPFVELEPYLKGVLTKSYAGGVLDWKANEKDLYLGLLLRGGLSITALKDYKTPDIKLYEDSWDIVKPATTPPGPTGDFTNTLGMSFVGIPAGTFTMGSPEDEPYHSYWGDETQHKVTISKSYYMQTTEVTQGQWKKVMGSTNNPSYFQNCGDNCPVEQVSWNDIQTFITKLNGMGQGTYTLPTEAQWEYAARAGTTTPFNTGSCLSTDQANFYGTYFYNGCPTGVYRQTTISVGSFAPNSWGLYDMHGNVWEWCNDWYASYPTVAVTDPVGPGSGSNRVIRGGSWYYIAQSCRSADRGGYDPSGRSGHLGFRLVCSAGHQ